MKMLNQIPDPDQATRSTLLVRKSLCDEFLFSKLLKDLDLSEYLHKLLEDPFLELKLNLLKAKKWKKTYQKKGQNLQRLHFYPDEADWARLSMISNGTGFSRCYIFVFLMLLDSDLRGLIPRGTPREIPRELHPQELFCSVFLDAKHIHYRKLTRVLQT